MGSLYRTHKTCNNTTHIRVANNELVVESKGSNQGLLDALIDLDIKDDDKYYIAFGYVVDNQDIRNKYRMLKSIADKAEGKIVDAIRKTWLFNRSR